MKVSNQQIRYISIKNCRYKLFHRHQLCVEIRAWQTHRLWFLLAKKYIFIFWHTSHFFKLMFGACLCD